MKVKLGILLILIVAGGVAGQKYTQFKNSPTGQVIEQIQEKKQLIEDLQKSPTLTIPFKQ